MSVLTYCKRMLSFILRWNRPQRKLCIADNELSPKQQPRHADDVDRTPKFINNNFKTLNYDLADINRQRYRQA